MAITGRYLTDLEGVLRAHLPKDSDPKMTDHVVEQWKTQLKNADSVTYTWNEEFGRKLKASWKAGGAFMAAMAYPEAEAESLRAFVRDWQACRRRYNLPAEVVTTSSKD